MEENLGKIKRILTRIREVWLILGVTFVLLVSMELVLSLAYFVRDRVRAAAPSTPHDWRAQADAYPGESWVHQYYDEFEDSSANKWVSYVYWRRKPYQGQYINVDSNGIRRTWAPDQGGRATHDRPSIFVFGGSTTWGVGARDESTIPSFLARKLKEKGIECDVMNFGESGYVTTQEVIALIRQLQKGNIPDLVIFYDGVNDVYSAYQQQLAGLPQNEFHRTQEFNLTQPGNYGTLRALFIRNAIDRLAITRFSRGLVHRLGVGGPGSGAVAYWKATDNSTAGREGLLREVLSVYEGNIRMVRVLGEAYGFETSFYWQPTVFDKEHRTAYEETQRQSVEGLQSFCQAVRGLVCQGNIAAEQEGVFHDLSSIFAEVLQPVFLDWCHLSEWGNEVVAERMAADAAHLFNTDPVIASN